MREYDLEKFIKNKHTKKLNEIVKKSGVKLEGNCLYRHHSNFKVRDHPDVDNLRFNLHSLAQRSNNIMEIGFNAGHSTLLSFLANPKLSFLSFDIATHKYTVPCAEYLQKHFDLTFIKGNSRKTVPAYTVKKKFDLIHIDGGHSQSIASNDVINCKKFAKKKSLLLIDDANQKGVRIVIEQYIKDHIIEEIPLTDLGLKETKFHKIFKYL